MRFDDATPLADPPPALRRRLEQLGFLGPHSLAYPARSRWALIFPDSLELWHALPLRRGHGGFPFGALPLTETALAVWRACDGHRSLVQVAEHVGISAEELRSTLSPWMAVEVQALQLRERPVRAREPALGALLAPERPPHAREEHHYRQAATDLERYHTEQIDHGDSHFDDRETTFAHVFERPHPALGGRSYGGALRRALAARGAAVDGEVLEVGPGTGAVCAAWMEAGPARRYLRLDLSPELLRVQAARCPISTSIQGSATAMPLEDDSVDLVLSNEMIADLRASPTAEGFAVAAEPGQALFNTGAFALVSECARVLRPGGMAFVSEFGGPDELPEETVHLDHPEVSIHFGQVAEVARQHGLSAELLPLESVLGVDRQALWLSRPSHEALRARAHSRGRQFGARARDPKTLESPEAVEGLWWVPVTEPGAGPVLDRLWALLLRKPEGV